MINTNVDETFRPSHNLSSNETPKDTLKTAYVVAEAAAATANLNICEKNKVRCNLMLMVNHSLTVVVSHDDALILLYHFLGGRLHSYREVLGLDTISLIVKMIMHQRLSWAF